MTMGPSAYRHFVHQNEDQGFFLVVVSLLIAPLGTGPASAYCFSIVNVVVVVFFFLSLLIDINITLLMFRVQQFEEFPPFSAVLKWLPVRTFYFIYFNTLSSPCSNHALSGSLGLNKLWQDKFSEIT